MSDKYSPSGQVSTYKMDVDLDNGYTTSWDLSLPPAREQFDISTVRLGRHGGETESDQIFRSRLYSAVGAITVAGGHVETAMKRLVLHLRGERSSRFSLVDKTWSDLHKMLVVESGKAGPVSAELAKTLKWGERNEVKRRRDDVVHAYWWNFDGCGVTRSRFFRREDGTCIVSTFENLEEDALFLFEYARRLDDLLGEDWPRAMLRNSRNGSK
ncbi:hypothetical protein AB0D24_03590 [Streptomyces javensis]|uniref:hypothetical protein n=1 Tax=Streptomyces javensis TaxID=114698 RepID=UPI0033E81000